MFAYLTDNCFRPVSIQQPVSNPIPEIPNVHGFYSQYMNLLARHLPYRIPAHLREEITISNKIPFTSTFDGLLGLTSMAYFMCKLLGLIDSPPLVSESIKQHISQELAKSVAKESSVMFYFDLSTMMTNYFRQTGHLDAYLLNIRNRIVLFASQETNQDCNELAALLYHTSPIPFQFYGRSAQEDDWDEKTQPALERAFQTYFTPSRILTELITEIKMDLRQKASYQGAQKTPYTSAEQHGFMQLLSELFDTICDETLLMQPDKTDLNWLAISQLLLDTMVRKGYFRELTPSLLEVRNTSNPILDITWPKGFINSPEEVSSLLPFLTNTLAGAHALLNTRRVSQAILYYFALLKHDPATLVAFKTDYYTHKTAPLEGFLPEFNIPPFAEDYLQESSFFIFYIQQLSISQQITRLKPMLSRIRIDRPQVLGSVLRILETWPEAEQVDILTQANLMCEALKNHQTPLVHALMVHMKSFSPQAICQVIDVIEKPRTSSIKTNWSHLPHYYSREKHSIIRVLLQGISNLPPETKRAILTYDKDQQSLLKLVLNHTLRQAFFDDFYEQNENILSYQLQRLPTDFFMVDPEGALCYLNALKTLNTTGMLPTGFLPNLILTPKTLNNLFYLWATKEQLNTLQNTMLALAEENPSLFLSGIETDPDIFLRLLTHHNACDAEKITRFFSMIPSKQLSHFLTKKPKETYEGAHLLSTHSAHAVIKPMLHAITNTLLQPEYFGLLFQSFHLLADLVNVRNTTLTYPFRQTILDLSEENQTLFFQEMDNNPHALLLLFLTHEDEGLNRLFSKISPDRKTRYLTLKYHDNLSLLDKALSCSQPATLSTLVAMNTASLSSENIRFILTRNHCSAFKNIVKQPHAKPFNLLFSLVRKGNFSTPDRHLLFRMALATQQDATRGFLFCVITEELLRYRGTIQDHRHVHKLFAAIVEGHYLEAYDIEDSYRQLIHIPHHPSFSFKLEVKFITYLESIKRDVPTELYHSLFRSYLTYLRTSVTPSHRFALIARWNAAFETHHLADETSSPYLSWIVLRHELISLSDTSHSLARLPFHLFQKTKADRTHPHPELGVEESKMSP